ncbi:gamma carbonic anhydrase family protein [Rathayibacter sp. VKM Ac-2759]|uniref:gamma carbonic anhydrase family protein n=1 Tax=Rathayibacter sp. VKM Ac-2759 TaxID=2609252 RepID=UPI001317CE74|nr:gamma carbonic anhydrase family protein [Rathayibacter sp. VKM Ac-2759]QHC65971.1 gamma carbonic anhydrase family protein [Rathayibacter sp. VKM Ac-2759]
MLIRHRDASPVVHPDASVASTAVLIGDVRIAAGARVLHGAVLTAEDGAIVVGEDTVVMENAVVRGRAGHPVSIGSAVMVGPHAHLNGTTVGDGAFIATGAALFPGSVVGAGAEVRIHGVVQVNTTLAPGAVVPIGWVAVGSPASILPPDRHDEIWAVQRTLDFVGTVYGATGATTMPELMRGQSAFYGAHDDDEVVES